MGKKTFTYGGFTFEPAGQVKDYGVNDDFRSVSNTLNCSNYGYVADGDEPYDYDEFYKAAGNVNDDVFRCLENNILYMPCSKSLQIFTPNKKDTDKVSEAYRLRRKQRDEQESSMKKRALQAAMTPTEEAWKEYLSLCAAFKKCKQYGFQFACDGDGFFAFRADLLKDITTNMVPMEGQEEITGLHRLYQICSCVWDAREGLYANVK